MESILKSNFTIDDLEFLLFEDQKYVFDQKNWCKFILEGEISIKDILYVLRLTSNKRKLIFEECYDPFLEKTRIFL